MRFDYKNRAQSDGRVTHELCGKPMLGLFEQDPKNWDVSSIFDNAFCCCQEPKQSPPTPDREEAAKEYVRSDEAEIIGDYIAHEHTHVAGQILGEQRAIEKVCKWIRKELLYLQNGQMLAEEIEKRFGRDKHNISSKDVTDNAK